MMAVPVRKGPSPGRRPDSCGATAFDALRAHDPELAEAPISDGVPVAPVGTIAIMKLLAGRTQDLADIEAIVASGADRDRLRARVTRLVPDRADTLGRLFENVDRER